MIIWKPWKSRQHRRDGRAERGEHDGDQHHVHEPAGDGGRAARPEADEHADDRDDEALHDRRRGAAERAADHDRDARHWRDQRLLQKPELPVPDQLDAGEDPREQHRHRDDAGRQKLDVVALARLLEYGTEPEAEREQKQQRLAERCRRYGPATGSTA